MKTASKNEWRETTLGDIAEKIGMGPFGSNIKVDTFVTDGVPVISGAHLRGTRLEDGDYNFVSREHADRLASANVRRGDVIFTHAGNIGQVAYIPRNSKYERYILSQRQFYLRPGEGLSAEYLTYYFHSPMGKHQLLTYANQVGVPSIAQPVSNLRATTVSLPSIEEQHSIVAVITSFDDKIELLRKQNETLERIGQTVFNEWFVKPDNDIRQVEWKSGKLQDIADNPRRGVRAQDISTETAYIGLEHLPRRSIALSNWTVGAELQSNKFRFQKGELLFGKLRPYFHKVGIAPVDGVCSTDVLVVVPKSQEWFGYVLCLISSDDFVRYVSASSKGTKMPRTDWDLMSRFPIELPPVEVAAKFSEFVRVLTNKIGANIQTIRALAVTREALLPKLMQGEIRV